MAGEPCAKGDDSPCDVAGANGSVECCAYIDEGTGGTIRGEYTCESTSKVGLAISRMRKDDGDGEVYCAEAIATAAATLFSAAATAAIMI